MNFRKADTQDLPRILEIQKENLLQNLEPHNREDGFLSIEYNAEQLIELNDKLGIFVAVENDHLAGYLIAQKMDYALHYPLIVTMVNRFPNILYRSRPLSGFKAFLYGPVCIHKESRGRGILEGLYGVMLKTLEGRYEIGVAFISRENPRSLYAHRDNLGMKVVDEFEFNGHVYNTLVVETMAAGREKSWGAEK